MKPAASAEFLKPSRCIVLRRCIRHIPDKIRDRSSFRKTSLFWLNLSGQWTVDSGWEAWRQKGAAASIPHPLARKQKEINAAALPALVWHPIQYGTLDTEESYPHPRWVFPSHLTLCGIHTHTHIHTELNRTSAPKMSWSVYCLPVHSLMTKTEPTHAGLSFLSSSPGLYATGLDTPGGRADRATKHLLCVHFPLTGWNSFLRKWFCPGFFK